MSLTENRTRHSSDFVVRVTHAEHVELHRLLALGMVHHQGLYGIYIIMINMPDGMAHLGAIGGRVGGRANLATHGDQLGRGGRGNWQGGDRFPDMTEEAINLLDYLHSNDTRAKVTDHNRDCNPHHHHRAHYYERMRPCVNTVYYYAYFRCDCGFRYRCNIKRFAVFRNNFPAGFFESESDQVIK